MTRRRRSNNKNNKQQPTNQWYKIDLHLHTPASEDYQQKNVSYLEVLQEAERRELNIIAFTDHNTVAGYKKMQNEIDDLELLERLHRLNPDEERTLSEYRRLQEKVLLLTGFEFTATFGFHILGIFPPETSIRELEFLLLQMNIPSEKLDLGNTEVGATVDVLTAYQLIADAGGIVIAAHANSSHGVALQGIRFGGQTRIAFTQDPSLHALEVTDLERVGKKTTARFFDGSKPEYPRRMRCIQGSDAHRLTREPNSTRNLGIGDRATEALLDEPSFTALHELFTGDDFARTRPFRPEEAHPFDHIQAARVEGPNIVQEFHEHYARRGGYLDAIIADTCAFANTNGGTLYIGAAPKSDAPPTGVGTSPTRVINMLRTELETRIVPSIPVSIDVQDTQGAKVVRIIVPRGEDPPYTMDESEIYIRSEAETTPAVRDEIVELVKHGLGSSVSKPKVQPTPTDHKTPADPLQSDKAPIDPPRTGVEIAAIEERNNVRYYTMRDLRNGNLVKNVTRNSARRLWRYAIDEAEHNPVNPSQVRWMDNIGIWKQREYSSQVRYDMVQKTGDEQRVYYGVTEEGIHGLWAALVGE
jgi:hypothetical protein